MAEKKDRLMDKLEGNFPPAFMFEEEGTMIVGKVLGFDRAYSKYGPHPVVVVQNEEDGEAVSVHCLHTALKEQMREQSPAVGDRVGIKYTGDKVSKSSGETYKNFLVRVDSPTKTFADVMSTIPEEDEDMPF